MDIDITGEAGERAGDTGPSELSFLFAPAPAAANDLAFLLAPAPSEVSDMRFLLAPAYPASGPKAHLEAEPS